MDRRAVMLSLGASAIAPMANSQPAGRFSFDLVKSLARQLAAGAYVAPPPPPAEVDALDYSAAQAVGFYRYKIPLWGQDWGVELLPLSKGAPKAITFHLVEDGLSRTLAYDPAMFSSAPDSPVRKFPQDAGYSGFRAISKDDRGEWLVFQGATYFRSPSPLGQYGLSARAIAADTYAVRPEEFPEYRQIWLERDATGQLVVSALYESPGIVGAVRINNYRTGSSLTQEIDSVVYFRKAFDQIGVAPLTSMFWFGEDRSSPAPDWRPEIHDSDGLAIWNGAGERLWRPLSNPRRVVTSSFSDENPRGFGLIQRDREFDHYHDEQARMERRPSVWVEPIGKWGRGSVRLVEIPTVHETSDNIVAFWTPQDLVTAGDALELRYRLYWTEDAPPSNVSAPRPAGGLARVVATRSGAPGEPGRDGAYEGRKISIEFRGENLLPLRTAVDVQADVTCQGGQIRLLAHYPGARDEAGPDALWRVNFDVVPDGQEPADVRVVLRQNGRPISEIWTMLVFPPTAGNPP